MNSNNHQYTPPGSRSRSSIHRKRSLESKCSQSSKSFKEKEVEDRVKNSELLAEAQYVEHSGSILLEGDNLSASFCDKDSCAEVDNL